MKFLPMTIGGAFVIEPEPIADHRGFFARAWCEREFAAHGLAPRTVQANIGFNRRAGTLRGLHYQIAPHEEIKVVRCTRGAVYDVIVDLRPDSPTHCRWIGVELTEDNHRMLYVPRAFAHGYQTLTDDAEIIYQTSAFYVPAAARGVRFDDPAFGIVWPRVVEVGPEAARSWPPYPESAETATEDVHDHRR